jgi:hypothetical protein
VRPTTLRPPAISSRSCATRARVVRASAVLSVLHATALLATCVVRAGPMCDVCLCGREQCRSYETPLNSNVNGNNDLKFYLEIDERAAGAHARIPM